MRRSLSGSLLRKISTKIFSVSTALVLSLTSLSGAAPLIFSQTAFAATQDIRQLVITTSSQTINVNTASTPLNVEAQNNGGHSASLDSGAGNSATLTFASTSSTGQFSDANSTSCTGNWGITTLTMLAGSADKHFCYHDSTTGTYTLTVTTTLTVNNNHVSVTPATQQITVKAPDMPTPSVTAGDFATWNNSPFFTAIDAGFFIHNFTDVSGINVTLEKNGLPLVSNTATQAFLDMINAQKLTTLSTPFILSGSLNDTYCNGGPCWSMGSYNWATNAKPDEAVVTVTQDGHDYSVTMSPLTENGVSFSSLLPADTTAPDVPVLTGPTNNGYYDIRTNDFDFTWSAVTDPSSPVTYDWESSLSSATNGVGGSFTNPLPYQHIGLTDTSLYEGNSSDGTYYWHVRACDAAGNCSAWATPWEVTIDTQTPTVPSLATPSNNSYINTNDFYFTWHASSDASPITYEFIASQNPHETNGVLDTGVWDNITNGNAEQNNLTTPTIHSTGAPDGTWYWQVRAIDATGNKSGWSDVWNVIIDTQAPANPVLVSPANGAIVNGKSVTQSWSDSSSDVDHYIYESYNDANATSLRFHGTYATTSKTATNVGEAIYWWRVMAVDHAGNTSGWSPLWQITVDNTAPAAFTLTGPSPVENAFENTTDFDFTWNPSSDANGVTYKICRSQIAPVNNVVRCDWGWTVRQSDIDQNGTQFPFNSSFIGNNGNYTWYWQVSATDAAGNTTLSNTGKVTIDLTAPAVSLSLPTDGSLLQGDSTTNPIVGSVQDNNLLGYAVALVNGDVNPTNLSDLEGDVLGGQWLSIPTLSDASFQNQTLGNLDASAYPDGQYTIVLVAVDQAYNIGWSLSHVTIDNTAPTGLANVSPTYGTYTTTSALTNIDWTDATDANGPITYYYESSGSPATNADGSFASPVYQSAALSSSEIPTLGTPEGVYYWHVRAVDAAGNSTAWTNAWKVTVDNTAPVVHITAPTSNLVRGTVTISGTVTDANPDHYYLVIKDAQGHVIAGPGTVYAATVANYNWDTTKVKDGAYTIDLEARDKAGNKDVSSTATMQVTVDNTAPDVPTAALTDANSNSIADNGYMNTKSFTFNLSDGSSDVTRYQLKYWNDIPGDPFNGEANAWNPTDVTLGGHSTTLGEYIDQFTRGEGVHHFRFSACDAAGNCSAYSTTPFTVTYDATAPATPAASLPAGTYTGAQQITLSSSDSLSGLASMYYTTDGSTPSKTNSTLYTGAISISSSKTIKAIAYDNAGNASDVMTAAYVINQPVTPHVLGATTNNGQGSNNDGSDGQVLGDATTQSSTGDKSSNNDNSPATKQTASTTNAAFLGLGWWWLAVLAILIALFMFAVVRRSDSDSKHS